VLVSVMKKHQRYFPVIKPSPSGRGQGEGELLPHFIAIRNGDSEYLDTVKHGNEHVLGARFADANFFVREDVKQPLEYYRAGLEKLIFQTKLGSMLDKSERIEGLINALVDLLEYENEDRGFAHRAAHLMKADLTTQMVTEMTSLQGIIGREYALRSGEPKEVAVAIGEQYQPIPQTKIGLVVALADRIDSLVGLFAAGLIPTGAKDPFGLRRAAIGTVQPLIEHDLDFDLRAAIEKSAATQPIPVSDEVKAQVLEFIAGRLRVVLADDGFRHDVVDAVLAAQSHNPAASARAAKALQAWVERPDWDTILSAFARCVRIVRTQTVENQTVDPARFVENEEKQLYVAVQTTVVALPSTVDEFLNNVVILIPAITTFFDKVLVMAEDQQVRENRLALLQSIASLSTGIADLSKLAGF
jgi:glycyl-tRNA synthetase